MYKPKEIEKIFTQILLEIEQGTPLRDTLKGKNRPSSQTFFKWLDKDELKSKQYARSCRLRADNMFDDLILIADDREGDVYTNEDGMEVTNHNVIQRARLRVDTRKWYLSKLEPKKYGDSQQIKLDHDITSKGNELNFTNEERDKRIMELIRKNNAK